MICKNLLSLPNLLLVFTCFIYFPDLSANKPIEFVYYADSMGEFRRQTSEKIGGMQVVNIRVGFKQGTRITSKLSWLIPRHKNYDYKGEKSRDPSLPPQYAMFGETTFKKLSVLWDGGAFQSHFIRARQNSDMLVQVISAWKYSDLMFADGLDVCCARRMSVQPAEEIFYSVVGQRSQP